MLLRSSARTPNITSDGMTILEYFAVSRKGNFDFVLTLDTRYCSRAQEFKQT